MAQNFRYTKGCPISTILPVRKLDELIFIRYKNFGSRLFRFIKMHAFDRQTDRQIDRRTDVQKDRQQQDRAYAFAVAR